MVPKMARLKRAEMCAWAAWRAACVDSGAGKSSVSDVDAAAGGDPLEVEGEGECVARNMWYVCTEARMKRHESGMVGRPTRRVRFWSPKALE